MTVTATAFAAEPSNSTAARHLQRGQEHCAAGRIDNAIAALQAGLDAAARDSVDSGTIGGLHAELGNAYKRCRRLTLASANYKAALQLMPQLASCWCDLANVQLRTGRAHEAIPLYLEALKLTPTHWEARTHLVEAMMATKQYPTARALLRELQGERPQAGQIHYLLGKVCFE